MSLWRVGDGPVIADGHAEAAWRVEDTAAGLGLVVQWHGPHDGLLPCQHDGPCATVTGRHEPVAGGNTYTFTITMEEA